LTLRRAGTRPGAPLHAPERETDVTTTRWTRFLRGWLTAGFSVVVAAFSHVAGGGERPALLGVVLALAFSVPLCVALARGRVSTTRLLPAVALSQLAFHLLFTVGAPATGQGPTASGGHHGPLVLTAAVDGASRVATSAGADHVMAMSSSTMWLAHGLAALLTVLGLRHGARCADRLVRLAARRLTVVRLLLSVTASVPESRVVPITEVATRRPAPLVFLTARPRRGPPVVA
jgi:hypothetical protein